MITIEYLESVQGFYLSCFLQRKQFGEKMVPKEEVLYILTEAKSYVPLYFILFFESITEQSIHDEANYNHLGYRQQAYGKEVRSAPMHTHHPGLRNRLAPGVWH